MTPEQKIKHAILLQVAAWKDQPAPEVTADIVDELYEALREADEHYDGESEMRGGEAETDLPCQHSRHYESKAVAAKMPDGSWVGWTYWYGGGKHGEPKAIDWMTSAYDLDCKEEEKVVTVRTFTKAGAA
jgi:hypothetical protein